MHTENKMDYPNTLDQTQRGASLLEYALLAVLIAVVAIAAITFLGKQVCESFSTVGQGFQQ